MFTAPQSNIRIEGFPSGFGEQGNIAKISKGTENMSPFFGNRGTKLYKLEDKNIVSKLIRRGTNYENVWEHGNGTAILEENRAVKDTPWKSLRINSINSSGGE